MLFADSPSIQTNSSGISVVPYATLVSTPPIAHAKGVDGELKTKYDKDNKKVGEHLLNHMTNPLFDLFVSKKSVEKIWNLLEKKYGADDVGKRKYVVGK